MIFGKVVGTVVSTQKDEGLTGYKLLVVQNVDPRTMQTTSGYVVTVDTVGAGIGEHVIVVSGSSARLTARTKNKPVDAAIIAIVDTVEIEGKIQFRKYEKSAAPAPAAG